MIYQNDMGTFYDKAAIVREAHQRAKAMAARWTDEPYSVHFKEGLKRAWSRAQFLMDYHGKEWVGMGKTMTDWIANTPQHLEV